MVPLQSDSLKSRAIVWWGNIFVWVQTMSGGHEEGGFWGRGFERVCVRVCLRKGDSERVCFTGCVREGVLEVVWMRECVSECVRECDAL